MFQERKVVKELFYISRKDEDQYKKDVALLYYVTMHEQKRIPHNDITEEKDKKLSSESDLKPDLNKDPYPHQIPKNSKIIEDAEIILC